MYSLIILFLGPILTAQFWKKRYFNIFFCSLFLLWRPQSEITAKSQTPSSFLSC